MLDASRGILSWTILSKHFVHCAYDARITYELRRAIEGNHLCHFPDFSGHWFDPILLASIGLKGHRIALCFPKFL